MAVLSTIPRGTILSGKYEVGRELGRGGMAAVYHATNVDIGKEVAIKLLAGHLTTSRTVVERFLREARAVSRIKSPHICEVFDSGRVEDGTPFLVMELLEGESLYDAMCRDRQMSPAVTLAIILQAGRGLVKAHEQNIVHRDLKPENIFLTVDDDAHLLVKVLDFGLAKFYDPVTTGKGKKHARLTREGAVFGTPAYMSPEQVRGQAAADTRADLWAMACITYECFTGTTVWSTEDGVAMTFAQIATSPLPDPRAYRPDLPTTFSDWFARALDRNIDARFQTVAEFADALAGAFNYSSRGGGLDPRLVDRITQQAADDSETVPGGHATRPAPIQSTPSHPTASHPSPHASGPVPSAPQSSTGPSPVVQDHTSILPGPPRRGIASKVLGGAFIGGLAAVAAFSYMKLIGPQVEPTLARSFGNVAANIKTPDAETESGHRYVAQHPWLPNVRVAQALISESQHDEALAMLRRLHEKQQHPMVRNLIDQVEIATQGRGSNARCQVTGYARPRRYDLLSQDTKPVTAYAPSIAVGIKGALMTWADSHAGQRRAYAVPFDDRLRNAKLPVDITPEGTRVRTPLLLALPDKYLAVYWDTAGPNTGVFVRWIGVDAVIGGPPVKVTESQSGVPTFATGTRTADGNFVVAWTSRIEADSLDLFYRRLDQDLKPLDDIVRVTDYAKMNNIGPKVLAVKVVEQGDNLHFAYQWTRGNDIQIRYVRIPTTTKAPGLPPLERGDERKSRTLADEIQVSPKTAASRYPSLVCDDTGCFVTWSQQRPAAAGVAFIDANTGKRQWHKPFSNIGKHPAVAIAASGDMQLAWIENQRIVTASLGREGVGPSSKVARVVGDRPPPVIATGTKRGEWYVVWLDVEKGHLEPYAARMQCQ